MFVAGRRERLPGNVRRISGSRTERGTPRLPALRLGPRASGSGAGRGDRARGDDTSEIYSSGYLRVGRRGALRRSGGSREQLDPVAPRVRGVEPGHVVEPTSQATSAPASLEAPRRAPAARRSSASFSAGCALRRGHEATPARRYGTGRRRARTRRRPAIAQGRRLLESSRQPEAARRRTRARPPRTPTAPPFCT